MVKFASISEKMGVLIPTIMVHKSFGESWHLFSDVVFITIVFNNIMLMFKLLFDL